MSKKIDTMESSFCNPVDFNVLQPPTMWINNRCFRVIPNQSSIDTGNYVEDDIYPDTTYKDEANCGIDFETPFEQLANGKIRTSFPVASSYLPYIIGVKGKTKNRIENDTFTQIRIPSKGQMGDVVVIGKDWKTVRQARIRLELLVDQAKKRQPFTHFISIPFNQDSIQENFGKFKEEVLEKCGTDRGVDLSLFQNPSKLHLTLCVLVLSDDRERQDAVKALQDCQQFIMNNYIEGQPLRVELKGIEYMNDDPSEVDVLYGKVQTVSWTHSLQELADDVVEKLVEAGAAMKQYETVNLHVTLMNTLFRSDKDGATVVVSFDRDKNEQNRETFDARQILSEFKDYYFGEMEISDVHLSLRYSTGADGYYSPSSKINITPI